MIIIAWIVLVINALATLKAFLEVFTDKTISGRVGSFVGCLVGILTCTLNIYFRVIVWIKEIIVTGKLEQTL